MLAVFSFAVFGAAKSSYAAKPSDYGLKDGDLISAIFSDDPDVYIVNENGYKRLFLNPEIFNFYGHLGGFFNVKLVSVETRDAFATSGLFRNCESNDPRVFGVEVEGEDMGNARWLDSSADTVLKEDSEFFKKVFCINDKEFKWYPKGINFKALKDLPRYERLKEKAKISTKEKIKKDLKYYGKDDDDEHENDDDDFYEKKIKGVGKVVICHKGKETITIGMPALKGHLKHGDSVGSCGETPPVDDGTASTTEDIIAPAISGVSATSTASTTADISWTTDESANSKVWYATSTPVSIGTASSTSDASFITSHNMVLSGLSALTQYFYFVVSADVLSNTATSSEYSITTPSQ